jgi:hypothetical protein
MKYLNRVIIASLVILSGCASYPVNPPLKEVGSPEDYRCVAPVKGVVSG